MCTYVRVCGRGWGLLHHSRVVAADAMRQNAKAAAGEINTRLKVR